MSYNCTDADWEWDRKQRELKDARVEKNLKLPQVKCKFCYCPTLHWEQKDNGKYQLVSVTGNYHICKSFIKSLTNTKSVV